MPKRPLLRAVNQEDNEKSKSDSGMNYRTVIILAVLTTVASQLALEGYRAIKNKWRRRKEENAGLPAFPESKPLPQPNPMFSGPSTPTMPTMPTIPSPSALPMPSMAPTPGPYFPGQHPGMVENTGPQYSPEELADWQAQLERKQDTLDKWQRTLQQEQRQLRLVGGD